MGRGRRIERTPPICVGPPPRGRVVQLDFDVCRPSARVTAAAGKSAWCVSRLGVAPNMAACASALGARLSVCAGRMRPQCIMHAKVRARVHYTGQLCHCAECALRSAAPCSGVPWRVATAGGSFDA